MAVAPSPKPQSSLPSKYQYVPTQPLLPLSLAGVRESGRPQPATLAETRGHVLFEGLALLPTLLAPRLERCELLVAVWAP